LTISVVREVTVSDEIEAGGATTSTPVTGEGQRSLMPMKVGSATVYVVQTEGAGIVGGDDEIYTAAPNPREIFDRAVDVIRECVVKIGEGVEALAEKAMPRELTVEFSLTFEAKGKTAILPVFVTAEHGVGAGLKISAVWKRGDIKSGEKSDTVKESKGGEER
jgi:hypothetical protein